MFFNRKYSPRDKNIDWAKFASSESASNCLPPPSIPKERLTTIPDMDYESPVQIYLSQMQGQLEDCIYNTVRSYGIDINKDELIKALINDRHQYVKGFRDGVRMFAEMLNTIEGLEENELFYNVINSIAEELDGGYIADSYIIL